MLSKFQDRALTKITPEALMHAAMRRAGAKKTQGWDRILRITGGYCWYCGCSLSRANRTRDHVIPRYSGGGAKRHNLVPCCSKCNSTKRHMPVEQFRDEHFNGQWFWGERQEILRIADSGHVDMGTIWDILDFGPHGEEQEE